MRWSKPVEIDVARLSATIEHEYSESSEWPGHRSWTWTGKRICKLNVIIDNPVSPGERVRLTSSRGSIICEAQNSVTIHTGQYIEIDECHECGRSDRKEVVSTELSLLSTSGSSDDFIAGTISQDDWIMIQYGID